MWLMLQRKSKETMRRIELDDNEIAFLNIGKNAGTQVKNIAEKLSKYGIKIRALGHFARLMQLPENSRYFFSVRKPETRFVSGFYSRKRKGQPLFFNEWTKHEAIAFGLFDDANELAENLSPTAIGANRREWPSSQLCTLECSNVIGSWGVDFWISSPQSQ